MTGLDINYILSYTHDIIHKLQEHSKDMGVDFTIYNPADHFNDSSNNYESEYEVMDIDLYHLRSSDIVLVNLDGFDTSDGTKCEVWDSWKDSRIILGYNGTEENLHPWFLRCFTRCFITEEEAIDYIYEHFARCS